MTKNNIDINDMEQLQKIGVVSQLAVVDPIDYDMRKGKVFHPCFTFFFETSEENIRDDITEAIQDEIRYLTGISLMDVDKIKKDIIDFSKIKPSLNQNEIKSYLLKTIGIFTDITYYSSIKTKKICNVKVANIFDNNKIEAVSFIVHCSTEDLRLEELLTMKNEKNKFCKKVDVKGTKSIFRMATKKKML